MILNGGLVVWYCDRCSYNNTNMCYLMCGTNAGDSSNKAGVFTLNLDGATTNSNLYIGCLL